MEIIILKAGAKLYRSDKKEILAKELTTGELITRKCSDTWKVGKYFGTRPLFATAMSVERKKTLSVGHFTVLEDIACYVGKYSFRKINHQRYYRTNGDFIKQVHPTTEENINHYDEHMMPLIDDYFNSIIHQYEDRGGEIFIVGSDLAKIKLDEVFDLPDHEEVLNQIKLSNYSFTSQWYKV